MAKNPCIYLDRQRGYKNCMHVGQTNRKIYLPHRTIASHSQVCLNIASSAIKCEFLGGSRQLWPSLIQ